MKTLGDFKEYVQAVVYLAENNVGVPDDLDARQAIRSDLVVELAEEMYLKGKTNMRFPK